MDKFDKIKLNQIAEINHTITEDDIKTFVDLTGDDNRLHVDHKFASETELKKPVVHGMLGASFISTVIGTKLPGDGALWFSQSLEFLLPVRIGDKLTVRVEVINKDKRSRVVTLDTIIVNQNRQKVTKGTAKVKIVEKTKNKNEAVSNNSKKNKKAIVIGGSGGIGSSVCMALAMEGYDVAIHYHNNVSSAQKVSRKISKLESKSHIFKGDITNSTEIQSALEDTIDRLGGVSVLVNCATSSIPTIKFNDLVWADFETHLNNQIKGVFNVIKTVVPYMEQNKYGKIINISSQAFETPSSNWLPYITSKGALVGFSKALAYELGSKGIHLNMISPGMTDTDLISELPERLKKVTAAKTPLNRLACAQDISDAVVFLASRKSDFMCGETLRVNGGQLMI
jgi:3-oxoacyl-[acyl-carrier protein] reductase